MEKSKDDESNHFHRTSSSTSILQSPSAHFDMNWHTTLNQSDSSIPSGPNQFLNRLATAAYNASSYKVSIGHETVNITEIARQCEPSSDPPITILTNERRRFLTTQKGANILSLCFMCFVSASLILISISIMHLLLKSNYIYHNDLIPLILPSTNLTPGLVYIFAGRIPSSENLVHFIIPIYDRTIRDLATVVCLLIIVLNCFCLLVFSIEIYLGCNLIRKKRKSHRKFRLLFSSSTSRFVAICSFYASIPALILVMCLFILLNMSLIPAIISLIVLGIGLIFILITLLTYFSSWPNPSKPSNNEKTRDFNGSLYQPVNINVLNEENMDATKIDELSTLV